MTSLCPCKKNKRELVSEPNVGRSERKHYGLYCLSCYADKGYVRYETNGLIWFEKQVKDDCTDEELFASLNPRDMYADRVPS